LILVLATLISCCAPPLAICEFDTHPLCLICYFGNAVGSTQGKFNAIDTEPWMQILHTVPLSSQSFLLHFPTVAELVPPVEDWRL
jgi:hypothetical protein